MEWHDFDSLPKVGRKIVIFSDDNCSTVAALVVQKDAKGQREYLEAEQGFEVGRWFTRKGAIWAYLPESAPLAFMEYDGE